MSASNLGRWGGLAAIAGGVLVAVGGLLQGSTLDGSSLGYLPLAVSYLGSLFLLGGLAGLHARQSGLYGRTGVIGFWVAFVGTLLGIAIGLVVVLTKVLTEESTSTAAAIFGGLAAAVVHLTVGLGLLLLGVATLRARVLPLPWRLVPLAIFLVDIPMKPLVVLFLGAELKRELIVQEASYAKILAFLVWDMPDVLLGVGWILLGYALWSGIGEGIRRPASVK